MNKKEKIDLLIILCFVLAITLPFINQAYHIDDVNSIFLAKQMVKDPLRMYDGPLIGFGEERLLSTTSKGPVIAAIIAFSLYFFKTLSEKVIHSLLIIFPLIGGISVYFLFKRFSSKPLVSTLLVLASPVFVVLSHTAMPNVAMFSLGIACLSLYIYGIEKNKNYSLMFSGIAGSLAILAKYPALAVLPLIVLYALLNKKSIKKTLIPVTISLFILFLWCLHNYIYFPHRNIHILYTGARVAASWIQILGLKGMGTITALGASTIFILSILYLYTEKNTDKFSFYIFAIISLILSLGIVLLGYNLLHSIMFLFFLLTGLMVLYKNLYLDKLFNIIYKKFRPGLKNSSNIFAILALIFGFVFEVYLLINKTSLIKTGEEIITRLYNQNIGAIINAIPLESWLMKIPLVYNNLIILVPVVFLIVSYLFFRFRKNINHIKKEKINCKFTYVDFKKWIFQNKDDIFMFFWFAGMIFYSVFLVLSGGTFRILFTIPPIIYLFVKESCSILNKKTLKKFLIITIILTFSLSIIISYADYKFANVYRDLSEKIPEMYENEKNDIWFVGHWGMQYYMPKAGYQDLLSNKTSLRKGDMIIRPLTPSPQPINKSINISLVNTIKYNSSFPIRTMNLESHAGFYSTAWGFLPYSVSSSPLEKIEIYEVI